MFHHTLYSLSLDHVLRHLSLYLDHDGFKSLPVRIKEQILDLATTSGPATNARITNRLLLNCLHPRLTSLDLSSIPVDEDTLTILAEKCRSLRRLNFANRGYQSHNLKPGTLVECFGAVCGPCLTFLNVSRCHCFSDEVLMIVAGLCDNIKYLYLNDTSVGDSGFGEIVRRNRGLRLVDISRTKITGPGICTALGGCSGSSSLHDLRLHECPGVTTETLVKIVALCANLEFVLYKSSLLDEDALFGHVEIRSRFECLRLDSKYNTTNCLTKK